MTNGESLLKSVLNNPSDDLLRLAFADWSEETGDQDRADFIRSQVSRAKLVEPTCLTPSVLVKDAADRHEGGCMECVRTAPGRCHYHALVWKECELLRKTDSVGAMNASKWFNGWEVNEEWDTKSRKNKERAFVDLEVGYYRKNTYGPMTAVFNRGFVSQVAVAYVGTWIHHSHTNSPIELLVVPSPRFVRMVHYSGLITLEFTQSPSMSFPCGSSYELAGAVESEDLKEIQSHTNKMYPLLEFTVCCGTVLLGGYNVEFIPPDPPVVNPLFP